ncbi:suppressor of tub2 mutation [Friedmanniomyces endolithicus]|uniref:Suppressor of tub2 mutation n=1 Tax=Friedmanniomyces endolithicus TaxID=329885 RepID=A0AAN6FCA9_9PEZI|nr:suppressor of tub2 mutation [Friedmanniomyces endolithicus]
MPVIPSYFQTDMPAISRPSDDPAAATTLPIRKHKFKTPKIRLHLDDISHDGSSIFLSNVKGNEDLEQQVQNVLNLLYDHDTPQPPTRSVTLVLRAFPGVAYTTGIELDNDHKEIHINLDYIVNQKSEPRHEILGVICHELVHCFQWAAEGTCNGGLIEGVADYVRLNAGLAAKHWRQEAGGKWDGGYQHTGYFLQYLEDRFGAGTMKKLNQGLRKGPFDEKKLFGPCCGGREVEQLWKEYAEELARRKTDDPQPSKTEEACTDDAFDGRAGVGTWRRERELIESLPSQRESFAGVAKQQEESITPAKGCNTGPHVCAYVAIMDPQSLLALLKKPAASSGEKLNALAEIKSSIKHSNLRLQECPIIFDCIRLAIAQQTSSSLVLSAVSTLGHLIKRLKIQDAPGRTIEQLASRLFPVLQERLGDLKEPIRTAVSQALTDLYPYFPQDVEHIIREEAIGGQHARAKEAGMQWVVKMHGEEAMPFKSYVSPMVARLEDADGTVRDAAKAAIIELFSNAPDRAKTDLKKQMKAHAVRLSIESQILSHLGASTTSLPQTANAQEHHEDFGASTRSLPALDRKAQLAESVNSEAAQPPSPETVPMDPLYVHSQWELDDIFRDMLPCFEGKEDEHNWTLRDKSAMKVRRLLKGNAPNEHHQAFMAGIKSVLDGLLKVANSLRTTMATNGSQLVQELARTLGPALDGQVEQLLQNFIKMSAVTKPIAAQHGRTTCDAIFQNCSYHTRMMQHLWNAVQDKNASARQCVPEWLKIILKRQAGYKQHFESSGGLELAEKTIKKGLDDSKPTVKENMRAAYWTFARTWPDRAEKIMASLDEKSKTALQKDSNNPNASSHASTNGAATSTSRPGNSSRIALREILAEQRKAKAAGNLPDRASSAMANLSPAKPRSQANLNNTARGASNLRHESRVVSAASTASETPSEAKAPAGKSRSALMSGPVRRPRRPEIARPQTADPYAARRVLRPETPANGSPTNSPPKGTAGSKTSIPASSTSRNRARTSGHMASPGGSPGIRSPVLTHGHPAPEDMREKGPASKSNSDMQNEDFTDAREDDLTMVLPAGRSLGSSSRAPNGFGHKRPGLGQTISVDSGIPAVAEDDGFTMVMPNVQGHQPRTRSPLAYRSPMKMMFDEAREQLERSASPPRDTLGGIEEALEAGVPRQDSPSKSRTPQPEEIQIYEDPFSGDAPEAAIDGERRVLTELQVNENVRVHSPTQSQGSSASPAGSPQRALDARSPIPAPQQTPQDRAETLRSRRLLTSGIERIQSKALDAHGFRRVQDLARSNLDIWEGGSKYDDLMGALLEYLQTFDQDPRLTQPPHKAAGLRAQALGLVRCLLTLQRKSALSWHPKALITVFVCRSAAADPGSHLLADLEKTANDITTHAALEPCIDATLDYLPSASSSSSTMDNDKKFPTSSSSSIAMALTTLRRLLESASNHSVDLGSERKLRLTAAAARYLDDADADVRKADTELASDLFALFGSSKAEFWGEFRGTEEGRLGLLTYYIARKSRGVVG